MFNYILRSFVILCILNFCIQAKNFEYAEYENDLQDIAVNSIEIEPRQFFLNWKARSAVRKILQQMPCGWSQWNIPPLAPYAKENVTFNVLNNFTSSYAAFEELRIDGLNNMNINKLSVSLLTFSKHIDFDFNFPNITTTSKFNLSAIIDHGDDFGFKLQFASRGHLNISLENVRLNGSFKFTMPILWGSVKVYDFKTTLTLGDVRAELYGNVNGKPITDKVNKAIEHQLLTVVNDNQILISALMEELLVPRLNAQLKGEKLLDIIKWSFLKDDSDCLCADTDDNHLQEQIFEF